MTYAYGSDDDKKRGPRWLLTFCAFCGDPHQVFPYGASHTELTTICQCTAGLQRARRWVRDELPQRELERKARQRANEERSCARGPRPPMSIETKLGA